MGQPKINTYINVKNLAPSMLHIKFEGFQPSCSGEKDLYILEWRPFCSCNLVQIYKFSLTLCLKATYEIKCNWPGSFSGEVL